MISSNEHPYLKKIGEDIITASGTTLLGADDKAGVAVIMDMANYLLTHLTQTWQYKNSFTPDEEIGRGVDKVDYQELGADLVIRSMRARGSFEDETFSADGVSNFLWRVRTLDMPKIN